VSTRGRRKRRSWSWGKPRGWSRGKPRALRISRTENHREQSACPAVGRRPAAACGRHMDREAFGFTSAAESSGTCEPSTSRSMPRVARSTASLTSAYRQPDRKGRLSLFSVDLCAKHSQCALRPSSQSLLLPQSPHSRPLASSTSSPPHLLQHSADYSQRRRGPAQGGPQRQRDIVHAQRGSGFVDAGDGRIDRRR